MRKRGEWNSFRIVGNDSACRRYRVSWKCWHMNVNVEALLLPVTSLSAEIHRRLSVANRSSLGLRKQLKFHCTVISTKIKLYTTFTRLFFYVLLTVHLSIFILIINQLDAQNLFYSKLISCLYMFRAPCAHRHEVKIVLYSLWYHHTL